MSPIFLRMSGIHLTFFGLPSGFADTPFTQRGFPLFTFDKFSVLFISPLYLLCLFVLSGIFHLVYHVLCLWGQTAFRLNRGVTFGLGPWQMGVILQDRGAFLVLYMAIFGHITRVTRITRTRRTTF